MNTKHTLRRSTLALSMAVGVMLMLLPWISAQANMLTNPGFESGPGGGGTPDNWAKWGQCGMENWAWEWGSYGMAFWGWNSGGGGFYQGGIHCYSNAMYYLRIRGLRESEFNSCNLEIKLEFYQSDDSTWVGAITNIVASSSIGANSWSSYSVTSGASFANAARVRPVIAYPGSYTPLGWDSQSYKWDNSTMYDRTLNYRSGEIVDEFSYDPDYDTSLNTKSRGGGFTSNWVESSAGKFLTADGSFGNLPGFPTNRGNKIQVNPADAGASGYRIASRAFPNITTGKIYFCTFVNYMWGTENGKWVGISLMSNATERAFIGAIGVSNKADKLNLAIDSYGGTRVEDNYELTDDAGNDYLIIGRYDFTTRQLDALVYWAGASPNTVPAAEPTTWEASATVPAGQIVMINGIRLGAGNASDANSPGNTYFDEVRVARSWKELLNLQEDYTWDGNGLTADWGDKTNWSGNVIPHAGTNATFYDAIPNGTNINLNLNTNVLGLKFNDTADIALNITNSTLTIGAGGIDVADGADANHVIASAVVLNGDQAWTNAATNIYVKISGVVSGTGNLTKAGNVGAFTLAGNNTFSGTLTINAGRILITHTNALGAISAGTTVASGPGLQMQGGIITAPEPLFLSGDGYYGGGALSSLSGNNTFTGPIKLNAASRINCDANTLILSGTITNQGYDLTITGSGDIRVSGILGNGAGGLRKVANNGTLYLDAVNTYTGSSSISGGVVVVGADTALGAAPGSATANFLVLDNGTLYSTNTFTLSTNRGMTLGTLGGTIQVLSGKTLTYDAIMAGAGALTKTGAGTLTLTGSSTHSGNTFINAGFFIQNGTNTSSAVNVSAGGTMYGVGSVGALAVTGGVSAGTAAGTVGNLRSTSMIIGPRGTNVVDMTAATGAAGTGWDVITVGSGAGTMTINGTAGASNIIRLVGSPGDFNNAANYSWTIVDAGTLSGFSTTNFSIDSSGFTPGLGGGTFSVANSSGDLKLNFTAASAPSVSVLGTNLVAIADGDGLPTESDGTDYGNIAVTAAAHTHIFTITNSGTAALGVGPITTNSVNTNFVVIAQPASSVAAGGSTTFQISFDPSSVGSTNCEVQFTNTVALNSPYNFTIRGTGTWAGIGRSPTAINVSSTLGSAPAASGFGVTNIGNGTLSFAISTNASWLTASPVSGNLTQLAGQQHTVTFSVVAGMQAGVSNATITITDANASNSPQTIAVAWTINALPDPSAATLTADGKEFVRLNWTKNALLPTLTFHRNPSATDVNIVVESAEAISNGAVWQGLATNVGGSWQGATNVQESATGHPVECTVTDPVLLKTNRFLRLRVSRP